MNKYSSWNIFDRFKNIIRADKMTQDENPKMNKIEIVSADLSIKICSENLEKKIVQRRYSVSLTLPFPKRCKATMDFQDFQKLRVPHM